MPKTNVKVKLTGTNGNVFVLGAKVRDALKKAGHDDLAKEFTTKLFSCGSYDAALALMCDYVDAR